MPGNIVDQFYARQLSENEFAPQLIYPAQATNAGVRFSTSTATAWSYAAALPSELMSGGDAPTNPFRIDWAVMNLTSDNGFYELVLYSGAAGSEVEIARTGWTRGLNLDMIVSPVRTRKIAGGSRISARLVCSVANANSRVRLLYHEVTA